MLIVRHPRTDAFDRAFDQLTAGWRSTPAARRTTTPSLKGEWVDGSLVLTVDLPGVPRDAVKVEVVDQEIAVSVDHRTERSEFTWSRRLQLGSSLDTGNVTARYTDGRLTVTVPPAPKPEPRTVTIDVVDSTLTVEPADGTHEASEASDEG